MADKTWAEYLKHCSMGAYLEFLAFHYPFVEAILEGEPESTFEVGCGVGNLSIFLSSMGIRAIGIDIEQAVVDKANAHNMALRGRAEFRLGDGFATGFPDQHFGAVISQGVLEHFDDDGIERFVAEGIRVARRSVHSMPNKNYPTRDFGNERLMDSAFWKVRGEKALARSGAAGTVRVVDYRRRFDVRHPVNSLANRLFDRKLFTLLIVERA
jgi:SAM-dependent methyltransferase